MLVCLAGPRYVQVYWPVVGTWSSVQEVWFGVRPHGGHVTERGEGGLHSDPAGGVLPMVKKRLHRMAVNSLQFVMDGRLLGTTLHVWDGVALTHDKSS